jgi:hypothetical protein
MKGFLSFAYSIAKAIRSLFYFSLAASWVRKWYFNTKGTHFLKQALHAVEKGDLHFLHFMNIGS